MQNIDLVEEFYQKSIKDVELMIPEGIYFVNLELLHHFDLLHFQPTGEYRDPLMAGYFQVIESQEKITLINNEFIVWIIPNKVDQAASFTYILIALNKEDQDPQLEAAIISSGIYNTSKLVLKILEKFLIEIQETEKTISNFQKTTS